MPEVGKKPVAKKPAPAATAPVKPTKEIQFPDVELHLMDSGHEGVITRVQMEELLGWETEESASVRANEKDGKGNLLPVAYGNDYTLKDEHKCKVRCLYNANNRPFRESHARTIAQDILNSCWAGPLSMPGETVNGEAIVISKYGEIISGQHRGVGFVLACQMWAKADKDSVWRKNWPKEPVLESVVIMGISDNPKVLRTVDNVLPRSEADVIYTSDLFSTLDTSEKRECSRMMAAAADLLWIRTGAGDAAIHQYDSLQTHSTSMAFIERHGKLKHAVAFIFQENKKVRKVSGLDLSPGQAAALLYLMAASGDDLDDYRNADPAPGEQALKLKRWKDAERFWALLLTGEAGAPEMVGLRSHLATMTEGNGNARERANVLCLAWSLWTDDKVALSVLDKKNGRCPNLADAVVYNDRVIGKAPDTRIVPTLVPQVLTGIDLGQGKAPVEDGEEEKTPEQIEQDRKEEADRKAALILDKKNRAMANKAKADAAGKPSPSKLDALADKAAADQAARANGKPKPLPAKKSAPAKPVAATEGYDAAEFNRKQEEEFQARKAASK